MLIILIINYYSEKKKLTIELLGKSKKNFIFEITNLIIYN